jgi:hypothetical protein
VVTGKFSAREICRSQNLRSAHDAWRTTKFRRGRKNKFQKKGQENWNFCLLTQSIVAREFDDLKKSIAAVALEMNLIREKGLIFHSCTVRFIGRFFA